MKTKQDLRSAYRQLRKSLQPAVVEAKSQAINQQFLKWLEQRSHLQHFHLFFPIDRFNEVNTFHIKESLEQLGKTLYTSQVNRAATELETLKLPQDAAFFLDEWGIPVPQESIMVSPAKIEVVFVPLLAYDRGGNRVGFGKGFYDAFLGKLKPEVHKIGLSFYEPEESIQPDPHDVRLDFCITPEKVLTF
ncbi:5-formyltetrahydrofolate cyclo-ligase [Algoriphagus sp. H41]|uniref:5-formyltetrahydrofolate cyclo-ligase n=1 Tax=Algoriphagus oliviformis TaxID=2811231 RepID=A0ABS3C8A2_9BACT|nr:5-formyltetrahydrofolate cyclo-ligase [Algoriphagus oliviformis]MBN7813212.1 5-formyltetrahydrofolate cyclo-ligase [Algoriphagus oliviformis]